MNEYRCTRNSPYSHECFGKNDLGARQGYYIRSEDEQGAHLEMANMFPEEVNNGFTIDLWRANVKVY